MLRNTTLGKPFKSCPISSSRGTKKEKAERKALVGKQFVNRPRAEDIQLKGFLFCLLLTVFFFFNQAYFEGYTELLGISTYCRLNFTMSRMELLIQGNFLRIIKAEVFLTASYSSIFASSQFYVKVTVDLSGINDVRKKLFLL